MYTIQGSPHKYTSHSQKVKAICATEMSKIILKNAFIKSFNRGQFWYKAVINKHCWYDLITLSWMIRSWISLNHTTERLKSSELLCLISHWETRNNKIKFVRTWAGQAFHSGCQLDMSFKTDRELVKDKNRWLEKYLIVLKSTRT